MSSARTKRQRARPTVYQRLLKRSKRTIEDVAARLLAAGFATVVELPRIITGERKASPGMVRALVAELGGVERDEVAAMVLCGWTTKEARAFLRALANNEGAKQ